MTQLSDEEIDAIYAKKEKKLRKILTTEQFNTWSSKHPEEFSPMYKELHPETEVK